MAGHIENLGGPHRPEGCQHGFDAARPRRVEDHGRRIRHHSFEQPRQRLLRTGRHEASVGDPPGRRVPLRGADGQPVQFHPHEGLDPVGEFDAEETHAAEDIHEVPGARVLQPRPDGLHQPRQEVEVVLEKRVGRQLPAGRRQPQHDLDPALRRWVGPDLANPRAQDRLRDRAFLDVHHQPAVVPDKSDGEALLGLVPLAADHDAVAVAVRRGTGDHRRHDVGRETTQTLEQFADLAVLEPQLLGVIHVLILAAAADPKVPAGGCHPQRRRPEHGHEPRPGEILLHLGELEFDLLAHQHERDEDHEVVDPRHALAAERDVADRGGETLADLKTRLSGGNHARGSVAEREPSGTRESGGARPNGRARPGGLPQRECQK